MGGARVAVPELFERLAIELRWECPVTGAKRVLRISWNEAWGIMARAAAADLGRRRVIYLADHRNQESLDGRWAAVTAEQVAGIEVMAMDMWEP